MKLMTAVLFCMSGALLFVLAYRNKESEHARNIVIASFSAAIFLLIGFSFVNLATGNNLALTPSWVSLVAFLTIAWFGTVSWRKKYTAWESRITGGLLLGLGSFALLGQLFNIPLASTATGIGMPFHSAFMSLLLGIGFLAIQE
jgi:hypothetical protein